MSIRLAARRHTKDDFHKINVALDGCGKALESGDIGLYFKENERFHLAIYGASHNHFLHESTIAISRRLGAYRRLQLQHRGRLHKSYEEHVGIVQALTDGDSALAASIIHQHVLVQGEHFSDLLASLEDSKRPI
jgi:DNA-binding GntR family transcriptional regulator